MEKKQTINTIIFICFGPKILDNLILRELKTSFRTTDYFNFCLKIYTY